MTANTRAPCHSNPLIHYAGKHRYDTQVQAKAVADASKRRKHLAIEPYRCSTCSGWHVGGQSLNGRKHLKHEHKAQRARLREEVEA